MNKTLPLVICFLLALTLGPSAFSSQNLLRIHFLNVGYGDAILIQFPQDSVMMIDSGEEEYFPEVCDYLKSLEITQIDMLMITHPHTNHFAGFKKISEVFPIGRVFINEDKNAEEGYFELLEEWRKKGIPISTLKKGDHLNGLPYHIFLEILHPLETKNSLNDNSLVSWLKYKNISFLLMADIEEAGQRELLKNFRKVKDADVIKMPHHGGPVIDELIKKIQGKILMISTGSNPWGLPREEDMKKLKGKIYRTDQLGTMIVETDGKKVWVKQK